MGGSALFWFMFVVIKETACVSQGTPRPPLSFRKVLLYEHVHSPRFQNFRALKIGDTFTPLELLPITRRLMLKVDNFVDGKGIVTSARSPEHLADKLFESFFKTRSRMVTLTALDLAGLDALQALALSGETVGVLGNQIVVNEELESPRQRMTCRFKLLKKYAGEDSSTKKEKRHGTPHKVGTNPKRKHNRNRTVEANFLKKFEHNVNNNGKLDSKCRWRYGCGIEYDLHTCQLRAECDENKQTHGVLSDIVLDTEKLEEETSEAMRQFRKMIGLSIVDEEVEKIIERRLMKLKPDMHINGEHIETLSEYFNNVIVAAQRASTPNDVANYRRSNGKTRTTPIATVKHHEETIRKTTDEGKLKNSTQTTPKANTELFE